MSGKKYDRIIIISDNESWKDSWFGNHGTNHSFNVYRSATGTDPYVYAIDIAGHGTTDLKKAPKVFHMTGWSDRLLDFIGKVEQGETLVDYVKNYHKKKYDPVKESPEGDTEGAD